MGVPATQADVFESEESVIKALAVIRNSTLPMDVKGGLRDLFMNYAGEADEAKRLELRNAIERKIIEHKDALPGLAVTQKSAAKPVWHSRPRPKFNQSTVTPAAPVAAASVPSESVPAPTIATPLPDKEEVKADAPLPAAAPAAPEPVTISAPPAIDLRDRINEIKHDVNSRVGNPVNLIQADENIGREYMAALLAAMKSISGGGGEEAAADRLEAAYQAAKELMDRSPSSPATLAAHSTPAPAPVSVKQPAVEPVPTSAPESIEDVTPAVAIEQNPATVAVSVPVANDAKTPNVPAAGLYHQPIDETEAAPQKSANRPGFSWLLKKDQAEEPPPLTETAVGAAPQNVPTPSSDVRRLSVSDAATAVPSASPLHALKDTTALPEQIDKLKTEAKKRAEEAKKPITDLNAPEIQAGLEKLLSEWSLFRSSGLFGTGGRGINHPLYKKLAPLPMVAVVSGRFEGSTPEIKQRLTDYMNGWRYEQGILHEMGETFEHYLRRVIKQIVERQRFSDRIGLS